MGTNWTFLLFYLQENCMECDLLGYKCDRLVPKNVWKNSLK